MSEALEKVKPSSPAQKSAARMAAVQALYTIDYTGNASGTTVQDFLQRNMPVDVDAPKDNKMWPEDFDAELFKSIVDGTLARQKDIDDMVAGGLDPKWPMDRLEKIIKSILRAGVGELLNNAKTDTAIIINDYVNVAHGFFAGKEPALVNAVLDKVSKSLRS